MGKRNIWFHFLALAVVAVWGVTFVSTKVLIGAGLLPAQIFAIRFTIAYGGIWLLCARHSASRKILSGSLRDELLFAVLGISGGSLYFLTENTALSLTQACNVSFIVCSAPLITAVLTLVVKRLFRGPVADGLEDIGGRWQLAVGSVLAIIGMAAVIFEGGDPFGGVSSGDAGRARGDLLALSAAICWGVYSIFMAQMTERYGALFATRKVFFYGLVTIIPFIFRQPWPGMSVFGRPEVIGNLLFLSVAASLCCFVLWNKVMARIGNVTATNYVYLNPFFTLVSAVLLLGESLTLQSALGCCAILGGVVIAGLKK